MAKWSFHGGHLGFVQKKLTSPAYIFLDFWYVILETILVSKPLKNLLLQFVVGPSVYWLDYS